MESLDFKRRVLKVDLYGEPAEIRYPVVGEYEKYHKEITKEDNNKSSARLMGDFLKVLGLTEEQLLKLEPEHLVEITNKVTGQGDDEKK